MTTPQQPANSTVLRGLGWDIDSPLSSNRGELLPVGSYGHTGFTGTSLWIDPLTQTYIIILTNAVHPRGGLMNTVSLRSRVATAVADALKLEVKDEDKARLATITGYNETLAGQKRLTIRNGSVLTGIDVLEAENFSPLRSSASGAKNATPRRIGVLTNQTGIDSQRRTDVYLDASRGPVAQNTELRIWLLERLNGVLATRDTPETLKAAWAEENERRRVHAEQQLEDEPRKGIFASIRKVFGGQ